MEDTILIKGGKFLKGTIKISGSKNLIVSIIPASLLSKDIVIINNVPHISDVELLVKILRKLNVKVDYNDHCMIIDARNITNYDLTMEEISDFRASYYFMGVMLSLFGQVVINYPGGCNFGTRPIDYHLIAFAQMGIITENNNGIFNLFWQNKKTATIKFKEISVGATVNLCLLCARLPFEIEIHNIAIEPEVIELLKFLSLMGVEINFIKERAIKIKGNENLHGVEFTIIPDRIEAGTYALLGLCIGEQMVIEPVIKKHLESLLSIFTILEVPYNITNNQLTISRYLANKGVVVHTGPYPNFPTDLQQPLTTYLSLCSASSIIIENIYHERFAHVNELIKMGADIVRQNNMIVISGGKDLNGTYINGKDLRGGASLLIAALTANGTSLLSGLNYINRGYDSIINKMIELGADISIKKEVEK